MTAESADTMSEGGSRPRPLTAVYAGGWTLSNWRFHIKQPASNRRLSISRPEADADPAADALGSAPSWDRTAAYSSRRLGRMMEP